MFFREHEHWFSLQNYAQFQHLSFCLRILEARDFIVSVVDFIGSGDFLFHVKEHFSEERRDLMY